MRWAAWGSRLPASSFKESDACRVLRLPHQLSGLSLRLPAAFLQQCLGLLLCLGHLLFCL